MIGSRYYGGGQGRGGAFGLRFDGAVDGRSCGLVVIVMGGGRSSEGRSHTIGAIRKSSKRSTCETKAVNPKSHVSFSSFRGARISAGWSTF